MKRHNIQSSDDIQKHFNIALLTVDIILSLLQGEMPDGTVVTQDLPTLQGYIQENRDAVLDRVLNLHGFKNKHNFAYKLEDFINKTFTRLFVTELPEFESKGDLILTDALNCNNFGQLKNVVKKYDNLTELASPVAYETPYRYANICNDLLDAASYTLNNVHPGTGDLYGLTDEEIRVQVKKVLKPFSFYSTGTTFPEDVDDIALMIQVHDSVKAEIDTADLEYLMNIIDSQVPKLPLIRRNWAT